MTNIIETKNLTKKFKNTYAIKNITMQVEKGSVYGLLGPNGAGKSTLLKIIAGALKPTSGEILFDGKNMQRNNFKSIGSIIEYPAIYPNLTAYENLNVVATLLNIDKDKITHCLKLVNLLNTGDKIAKNFSMGMKQRLGIAISLMNGPQLLILDEPTNGLDPLGIQEIRQLIKDLSSNGITIIISSHILSEIQQVADTIGIIYDGHLSYQEPNNKDSKDLEELFMKIVERERSHHNDNSVY